MEELQRDNQLAIYCELLHHNDTITSAQELRIGHIYLGEDGSRTSGPTPHATARYWPFSSNNWRRPQAESSSASSSQPLKWIRLADLPAPIAITATYAPPSSHKSPNDVYRAKWAVEEQEGDMGLTTNRQARFSLTVDHARKLKYYSDTPIAWRDALLMCLLLNEHLPPKMINHLLASSVDIQMGILHLTTGTALKLSSETRRLLHCMHEACELRGYLVPGAEADEELHHDLQVAVYNRVHLMGERRLGISNLTPRMCLDFKDPSLPPPEIVAISHETPPFPPVLERKERDQSETRSGQKAGRTILFNATEFDSDSYRLLNAVARYLIVSIDEIAATLHPLGQAGKAPDIDGQLPTRIRSFLSQLKERGELHSNGVGIIYTRQTHPALVTLLDRELFLLLNTKAILLEVRHEEHAQGGSVFTVSSIHDTL